MEGTIGQQLYIFLTTLYGGIIIGFIYDLYRIFRYFSKPKKIATMVEDLFFWIIIALISLFILIFSNWGEIRAYVFLGFISGAYIYSKMLSKIIITIMVHTIRFVVKYLKKSFDMIVYPFKLLGNIFYTPYKKMIAKIKIIIHKIKRIIKLPSRVLRDSKRYIKTILRKK